MTKKEEDVYKASPEDRKYAEKHPFRPASVEMHIAIRIPPLSFSDLVNLNNLVHYNMTYS